VQKVPDGTGYPTVPFSHPPYTARRRIADFSGM
jgi:hypothetical protein